MRLKKYRFPGSLSQEVTEREIKNREISEKAACEGIVLLENDGILPLDKAGSIALYGGAALHTVIGGTGSGSVNNRDQLSIYDGLKREGVTIANEQWLQDYEMIYREAYRDWKARIYEMAGEGHDFNALYRAHAANPLPMPAGPEITKTAADTAVYVISRVSGEGADRKAVPGDYYLSLDETNTLHTLTDLYSSVIVVLNVGGIIDCSFMDEFSISALVLLSLPGMNGGGALAKILTGSVNPSGHLTDTWAYRYDDYPSSRNFSHNNGNIIEEKYTEGIYVGYRYFDSFGIPVRYPFGYGLSYTDFAYEPLETVAEGHHAAVRVRVTNTGSCPGRQVIQLYAACPQNIRPKEAKRLVDYRKTRLLAPGEEEVVTLSFPLTALSSYHTGKSSYFAGKGRYYLLAGVSAASFKTAGILRLDHTVFSETFKSVCPLLDALKEITPPEDKINSWLASLKEMSKGIKETVLLPDRIFPAEKPLPVGSKADDEIANMIISHMTLKEKATICCGRLKEGIAEVIGTASVTVPGAAGETSAILKDAYNVGNLVMADGPAGIRIRKEYEEDASDHHVYALSGYEMLENRIFGKEFPHENTITHYQYCTAIPVGTLLAQTFDSHLLMEVGRMVGTEMEEFGISLWLAPGMNIHRNPLCGRNFEYYSEDPVLSGFAAACITKGVQSLPGLGTTIKHFACNNQEENRRGVSSIVSERALREIYLKGFEIAVKSAQPMAIMTSYNKLNGVHTANSYDLCTELARNEWHFKGIIMTDWTTTNSDGGSSAAKCIAAGNDLIMPGSASDVREIMEAVLHENDQHLDIADLNACARRMISLIYQTSIYENAVVYKAEDTYFINEN